MATDYTCNLLATFGHYMYLEIYVDSDDVELKERYVKSIEEHNNKYIYGDDIELVDAGFDLFAPTEQIMSKEKVNKLDYNIICRASIIDRNMGEHYTGFYMYPRSSISKSNLRLANNVGIIDAGYRGHLMGMFDVIYSDIDIVVNKLDRHLQICAPNLMPICVRLVEDKELLGLKTLRGKNGFGSTGK
jgi:dUTP pyrophosphatase